MDKITIIEGNFFEIAETIKDKSVSFILVNSDYEEYIEELKCISSRIIKKNGASVFYNDHNDMKNILKERTTKDDTILSFGNDVDIALACKKLKRSLVFITENVDQVNKQLNTKKQKIDLYDLLSDISIDGVSSLTNKILAEKCDISERTVIRMLKRLENDKKINVLRNGNQRKITIVDFVSVIENVVSEIVTDTEPVTPEPIPDTGQEQKLDIEAEYEQFKKELAEIDLNQVEELRVICKENNLDVDEKFIRMKIRSYSGITNFKMIRKTFELFFQEILNHNVETLNYYLADRFSISELLKINK